MKIQGYQECYFNSYGPVLLLELHQWLFDLRVAMCLDDYSFMPNPLLSGRIREYK